MHLIFVLFFVCFFVFISSFSSIRIVSKQSMEIDSKQFHMNCYFILQKLESQVFSLEVIKLILFQTPFSFLFILRFLVVCFHFKWLFVFFIITNSGKKWYFWTSRFNRRNDSSSRTLLFVFISYHFFHLYLSFL